MESVKIQDYLENYNRTTNRGACKSCLQLVQWTKERIANHKRGSCQNFSAEEKSLFAKRKFSEMARQDLYIGVNSSDSSFQENPTAEVTHQEDIDAAFPNFFFRTGIAFRIADSQEMNSSSAPSERVWSTYRFIHSRLRNRLSNEKVEKLAFVYVNCSILDKMDQTNYFADDGAILSGVDCQNDDGDHSNSI
jgi:hypothetical protein